ncbi:MAG: hypothetical protein A4E51_00780 [Methanosaeta sp. PtaU1.Bin055]|nr:MAG: hypothetical protein A4E51_00780 [Methanosaeta sp. PtaU1.Bin055]
MKNFSFSEGSAAKTPASDHFRCHFASIDAAL